MKVLTLNDNQFKTLCGELSDCIASSGFYPNVIIGIINGGAYVANEVAMKFPQARLFNVEISRKTKKAKNSSIVRDIFSIIPIPILNAMRIIESHIARLRNSAIRYGTIAVPDDIAEMMHQADCNLLIIDDAIDTGATMMKITAELSAEFPNCSIRTAVITTTTEHPSITADYSLYHNNTLIRFPWSIDART